MAELLSPPASPVPWVFARKDATKLTDMVVVEAQFYFPAKQQAAVRLRASIDSIDGLVVCEGEKVEAAKRRLGEYLTKQRKAGSGVGANKGDARRKGRGRAVAPAVHGAAR